MENLELVPYQSRAMGELAEKPAAFLIAPAGSGKTAVVGRLLTLEDAPSRAVYLTLSTLKEQTARELRSWSKRRVGVMYGRRGNQLPSGVEVIVCNYEIATARRFELRAFLESDPNSLLICDECQRLVNPDARITRTVLTDPDALFFSSGAYIGMSATPFPNWLADAAPHFYAMTHSETLEPTGVFRAEPTVHGIREVFAEFRPLKPRGRRIVGNKRLCDFQRLLSQVEVRVSAQEVEDQLPRIITRRFALGDHKIADAAIKAESSLAKIGIDIDSADLDLLEQTNSPELHVARRSVGLLKAQAYCELAKAEIEAGDTRQRVVFYHHVAAGELMAAELGWPRFGGDVNQPGKKKALGAFKKEGAPGILLQLQSGGTGLDLPEGEIADFVELPWSPASYYQATRRIARLSSEHPRVLVRIMFVPDTLDQRVSQILSLKGQGLRAVGLEA
ncbi:DEAD/DEAH box helicase [Ruegeria arenilitoris]|uniref:DEAD/DEAH box helicase n=1 Tax=Ruegeria arenilitoris TaxID=1173585 RepID=UPI00147A870C|nr:DEAD/DEAH box helicase [Ruegeria arenilitoris]